MVAAFPVIVYVAFFLPLSSSEFILASETRQLFSLSEIFFHQQFIRWIILHSWHSMSVPSGHISGSSSYRAILELVPHLCLMFFKAFAVLNISVVYFLTCIFFVSFSHIALKWALWWKGLYACLVPWLWPTPSCERMNVSHLLCAFPVVGDVRPTANAWNSVLWRKCANWAITQ